MAEIHDLPTHAVCGICGAQLPAFMLQRHMERCHPVGAEDTTLSTYDAMHPNSASAKFAELVRQAAEKDGAK